jgi:hypothetical protein
MAKSVWHGDQSQALMVATGGEDGGGKFEGAKISLRLQKRAC